MFPLSSLLCSFMTIVSLFCLKPPLEVSYLSFYNKIKCLSAHVFIRWHKNTHTYMNHCITFMLLIWKRRVPTRWTTLAEYLVFCTKSGAAAPSAGTNWSDSSCSSVSLQVLPTSTTGACWERGTARWRWSWRTRRRWRRWWTGRSTRPGNTPCSSGSSASSTETSCWLFLNLHLLDLT